MHEEALVAIRQAIDDVPPDGRRPRIDVRRIHAPCTPATVGARGAVRGSGILGQGQAVHRGIRRSTIRQRGWRRRPRSRGAIRECRGGESTRVQRARGKDNGHRRGGRRDQNLDAVASARAPHTEKHISQTMTWERIVQGASLRHSEPICGS
jgi:hypothetical protein